MKLKIKLRKLEKGYRPTILMRILLTICIITYLISASLNLFIGLFNQYAQEIIKSEAFPAYMYFYRSKLMELIINNEFYFIIISIIQIVMIISFVVMFRGFTTGYYSYFVSQICAIIFPILMLGKRAIALGDIMIALFLLIFFLLEIIIYQTKPKKEETTTNTNP